MRPENKRMQALLRQHGIKARAKYLWHGSLRGCWRLYAKGVAWTDALRRKLSALDFLDFDHSPLSEFSGNGGDFSVCVRGHKEMIEGLTPPTHH